jgi:hypothetical protein
MPKIEIQSVASSLLSPRRWRHPVRLAALASSVLAVSAAGDANAHIQLLDPPSWVVEDAQGNPQKTGPCGGTAVTETGTVTTFRAGQTIPVKWQETVGHSGHFRISLARDRADLVDPDVVTSNGDGVSGNSISATIESPVAYPVLVDGLFPRDSVSGAQAEPFETTVTLPDEECEDCTLQVIQFMSQHGPGYFYHHCANVRIVAADAELPDGDGETGAAGSANASTAGAGGGGSSGAAGTASSGTAGTASRGSAGTANATSAGAGGAPSVTTDPDDSSDDDGGCSISPNPHGFTRSPASLLTLVLGAAAMWRRARSRRR